MVSEGGLGLSGGQKQSILLARILVRNPHILLLDEPTASLDDITEREFIAQISKASKDKTLIISTHKMSILNMVDRVIAIANGQIVLDESKEAAIAKLSGIEK